METVILPPEVEAFVNAFKQIGGGNLSIQAGTNLAKAIKATMIECKKSTVNITLEISKTNDEMISISGAVKTTLPTPKITAAFFVDTRNYLPSRNRPDQMVMDFKERASC